MMKGFNYMYDFMRRPSLAAFDPRVVQQQQQEPQSESPLTPVPEHYEIDDEFNVPISVAITMLLGYMIFGAVIYQLMMRGEWSFFEALYFVFISISTIGELAFCNAYSNNVQLTLIDFPQALAIWCRISPST